MTRSLLGGLLRPAPFAPGDDPDTAPFALPGSVTDLPYRQGGVRMNLLFTYLVGLVFLVFALPTVADDVGPVGLGLRIAFMAVLAVAYVGAAWTADASLKVRWAYIAGFTGFLVIGGALLWGWEFANFGVYPAVLVASLIPWHQARVFLVGWALVLVAAGLFGGIWTPVLIAALSLGIGLGVAGWLEGSRIRRMLERTQNRVQALTVAAERARISRDLHDILGHSLTAITIKSSLAARLVDTEPAAAKEEMAAVEGLARQALADVRATVSGLTEVRLATEIASARSVLLAAGVEAHTPSALPTLPDDVSELFGYVVRESVTNVVRHAEATMCVIDVDERSVAVRDDGIGLDAALSGNGLMGLRERVAAAGGALETGAAPAGGTIVRAVLHPSTRAAGVPR
jgi:two-component system sensor histidine kinase DesK